MNRHLTPLLLIGWLAFLGMAQAEEGIVGKSFENPIVSGDWSDPALIRVGDDFYSCRSSFGWQPGIPIVHSRDLVHWRYVGHAFSALPELRDGDTRGGIWGLDMGFNPNTKQFLIYAPMHGGKMLVFSSSRPEGPYAMHSLGEGLGIDPGFFADEDGQLYLITSLGVIHRLSRDGLSLVGEAAEIDRTRYAFFEGPTILKRGAWYYVLFSDGGTLPREPSTISTLRSNSLEGPWEEDPENPVMTATDTGSRFEGPAHGTLIQVREGEWFVAYHAHETAFYSLGRQMLLQPIQWTKDGWWRPAGGKMPIERAEAPSLPSCDFSLAQSDEFPSRQLGLQWFFLGAPDYSGAAWSLSERSGWLRIRPQPGDLSSLSAIPGIFQQRVIHKRFSFEIRLSFDAREEGEAAGLHLYHDPKMNLWLASSMRQGKRILSVGKTNLGKRSELWSCENPFGEVVHLKIDVDGEERAHFFFSGDGKAWAPLGESIYFGASGNHLRHGERGNPDLGWVGRYKDRLSPPDAETLAAKPRGNVWTATGFGLFAVRGSAATARPADFDYVRISIDRLPGKAN